LYRSGSDSLEIFPGLRVSGSLTSSGNVYAPQITASVGFKGDGSQLTNLPLSSYATLTGVSGTFVTNTAATSSLAFLTASNNFTANQKVTGSLFVSSAVSASQITGSFSGSGALLNNLTASNINNFSADVRDQISVTSDLTYTSGQVGLSENPTVTTLTASQNVKITGIPSAAYTNIVVASGAGVLGTTSLSALGGVSTGTNFTGVITGTVPNAIGLIGSASSTYSTIPLYANGKNTVRIEVEDRATAPDLILYGGSSIATSVSGGDVGIVGGDSAAASGNTGNGGDVILQGGTAGDSSSGTSGKGGSIYLVGGTSTGGTGGDIYIQSGDGVTGGGIYLDVDRPKMLNFDLEYYEPTPSIHIGTIEASDTNIKISGSIIPSVDDTYILGFKGNNPSKRWKNIFTKELNSTDIYTTNATINGLKTNRTNYYMERSYTGSGNDNSIIYIFGTGSSLSSDDEPINVTCAVFPKGTGNITLTKGFGIDNVPLGSRLSVVNACYGNAGYDLTINSLDFGTYSTENNMSFKSDESSITLWSGRSVEFMLVKMYYGNENTHLNCTVDADSPQGASCISGRSVDASLGDGYYKIWKEIGRTA
jgi:hypothetical protein